MLGKNFQTPERLWERAKREIPPREHGWQMFVKFKFCRLLLEYLNSHGENFTDRILDDDITLVHEMALEKKPAMPPVQAES